MPGRTISNEEIKFMVNDKGINGILTYPNSAAPYPAIVPLLGSHGSSANDPYYAEHYPGIRNGGSACRCQEFSIVRCGHQPGGLPDGITPAELEIYRVEAMSRAAGFGREMTELAYNSQPIDLVVEFRKVPEIFEGGKDERWAKFLYPDQGPSGFNNLPPQAWGKANAQMLALMEADPSRFLKKVHCLVLAMFGENDTFIPVEKSITTYKHYLDEAGREVFTGKVITTANHTIRGGDRFADGDFDLMRAWWVSLSSG